MTRIYNRLFGSRVAVAFTAAILVLGLGVLAYAQNLRVIGTTTGEGEAYFLGKVGIGTTLPGEKLDVVGRVRATSHIQAGNGNGGVALTINDGYGNANVTWNHMFGIPEQSGNAARIEVNTDATTNAVMDFELGSGVTSGVATSLTNVMRLRSDGNVGIGTTAPVQKLHVVGTVRADNFEKSDGSPVAGGIPVPAASRYEQTSCEAPYQGATTKPWTSFEIYSGQFASRYQCGKWRGGSCTCSYNSKVWVDMDGNVLGCEVSTCAAGCNGC